MVIDLRMPTEVRLQLLELPSYAAIMFRSASTLFRVLSSANRSSIPSPTTTGG